VTVPRTGGEVRIFDDRISMDRAAADLVAECAEKAVGDRGGFSVALAGGFTPRGLYALLASSAYRDRIPWARTHVFWADERCVPSDHEDSNYRLAAELFLSKVPLLRAHIHRIRGEDDPAEAAKVYEDELRSFFGGSPITFDLVILGMGADGHTASLFPGEPATAETGLLAVPVPPQGARRARITLTFPAINDARKVLFLVAGAEKAPMVRAIFGSENRNRYPAGLVRPVRGTLVWYLDSAAAGMLRARS
jgi:6-phosphogluconolactonase